MERPRRQTKAIRLKSSLVISVVWGMLFANSIGYAQQLSNNNVEAPAHFNWAGPSIGAYVGGGWGHANLSTNAGSVAATSYYNSVPNINSVNQSGSGTVNPSEFIGGIQFSDNFFLRGPYILGWAMDYGTQNFNVNQGAHNVAYPDGSGNYSLQTSMETNWVYTARARLGYALSSLSKPVLLYMTGGLALTNLSVSNQLTDTTSLMGMGGSNSRVNQAGWTLGAGFEFPMTDNLTINCEYLYMHFGTVNVNSAIYNAAAGFGIDTHSLVSPFKTSANLHANILRAGLNYKFKTL